MRARRLAGAVVALAMVIPLVGCGEDEQTLTVLAAASLTDVFEDLAERFEEEHGVEVELSFGSSTALAEQAADGAPGDVLATADETSMQIAEDARAVFGARHFASNALRIVTPPDDPGGVDGLEDLTDATWVRCADEVPCGRVADAVLRDNAITAEPDSLEEDVRAVLDKVVAGEAEAGLVYASDAASAGEDVRTLRIEGASVFSTSYRVGVLAQTTDLGLAGEWVNLLTSDEGRTALRDAGFTVR